jgi:hypothetical protein
MEIRLAEPPQSVKHGIALTNGMSRRSFLSRTSALFVGLAAGALLSTTKAAHAAQAPCYGGPTCQGCDLNGACDPHCPPGFYGCPTNTACWYACASGRLYRCCDCSTGGSFCVVRKYVGTC